VFAFTLGGFWAQSYTIGKADNIGNPLLITRKLDTMQEANLAILGDDYANIVIAVTQPSSGKAS
jgi:hypothetical protein